MAIGWLEVVSDLTISLSYFSIPISLASFAVQQDLRISYLTTEPRLLLYIKTLIVLVIAFVGLCGVTHLISCLQRWTGAVVAAQLFTVLTAVVSFTTAAFLHRAMPILISTVREIELTKRGLPDHLERIHQVVFYNSAHIMSVHSLEELAFVNVNDAVRLVGLLKENVLASNLYELAEEEDRAAIRATVEDLKKHPESTQELVYHIWNVSAKRLHTMEASMFFGHGLKDDQSGDQSHVLLISRDVTDRDEREAAKRERLKFAEGNKARMRYISSIAHDLKTPLTTFKLCLGLLQSGEVSVEQKSVIEEAEVSVEMMGVTISQAVDSARITDQNQLKPKRGRVSISELISKCEKIMCNYAKCVPITFHVSPDVSSHVMTDGEWVWQMCVNLLTNACKYTVRGSIHLEVSIVPGRLLPHPPLDAGDAHLDDEVMAAAVELVGDAGAGRGSLRSSFTSSSGKTSRRGSAIGGGGEGSGIDYGGGISGGGAKDADGEGRKCGNASASQEAGGGRRSPPSPSAMSSSSISLAEWQESRNMLLCFGVSDTGIGVADEMKPRLFKAFTQLQSMQSNGTGLGLYSVLQKSARLHGTCGMRDNTDTGGGSVFFFAVPYVPDLDLVDGTEPMATAAGQDLEESGTEMSSVVETSEGHSRCSSSSAMAATAAPAPAPTPAPEPQPAPAAAETRAKISSGGAGGGGAGGDALGTSRVSSGGDPLGVATVSGVVLSTVEDATIATNRTGSSSGRDRGVFPTESGGFEGGSRGRRDGGFTASGRGARAGAGTRAGTEGQRAGSGEGKHKPADVLVVDDTSTVRNLLKRAITNMGLTVDTAKTGEEALKKVEQQPYQLVLCDLQMPVMDGPEFVTRWRLQERLGQLSPRRQGKRQHIIGMSANNDLPDVQVCRDCDMDGFCPKPITIAVLKHLISDHCEHGPGSVPPSPSPSTTDCAGRRTPQNRSSLSRVEGVAAAVLAAEGQKRANSCPERASLLGWPGEEEEEGGHKDKPIFRMY